MKKTVGVPVGAKLAPHRPMEIHHLAALAQEAGADFLTLINCVPAMSIDIETFPGLHTERERKQLVREVIHEENRY